MIAYKNISQPQRDRGHDKYIIFNRWLHKRYVPRQKYWIATLGIGMYFDVQPFGVLAWSFSVIHLIPTASICLSRLQSFPFLAHSFLFYFYIILYCFSSKSICVSWFFFLQSFSYVCFSLFVCVSPPPSLFSLFLMFLPLPASTSATSPYKLHQRLSNITAATFPCPGVTASVINKQIISLFYIYK